MSAPPSFFGRCALGTLPVMRYGLPWSWPPPLPLPSPWPPLTVELLARPLGWPLVFISTSIYNLFFPDSHRAYFDALQAAPIRRSHASLIEASASSTVHVLGRCVAVLHSFRGIV